MKLKDINFKYILRGVIVFLIFWYSVLLQYIPVIVFKLNIKEMSLATKGLLSFFSSCVIAIIFFVIYRKDIKKDWIDFRKNYSKYMDVGFKYWMTGLIIMCVSNFIIVALFHTNGANNENKIHELINAIPFIMFISASIIGPFNEEITFRKTSFDVFKNKWVYIAFSFILFGGAHVISGATVWTDYLYIIPYGSLGAFLALIFYDCKNMFPSIFIHMIHNAILLIISIIPLLIK